MNPAEHYDPTMMLDTAVSKNNSSVPAASKDSGPAGPEGVGHFDGAANLGTTTVERMPLQTFTTPPDNGLSLPDGARNFGGLSVPPRGPITKSDFGKRFHGSSRNV